MRGPRTWRTPEWDAIKLRDCAVGYRTADDEAAAAPNDLLSEFES